ncbi:unnamed protein product [Colias eurytheme]|nr:unnamed protein product [Colias eurytheme]
MFADDTVLLFHGHSWEQAHSKAERGLKNVTSWLEDNLLTLNISKTKYLCFSKTATYGPSTSLTIRLHSFPCNRGQLSQCNCATLTRATSIRYLGILVDDKLSWKDHITHVCNRVRKLVYIFKHLRSVANKKLLIQVYKALCESIINYCVTSWGGAPKTIMSELERAQRAVLKVLMHLPYRHSTADVYAKSGVLSVRKIYILKALLRYHRFTAHTLPRTWKRKLRCPIPTTKTHFAKRQLNCIAPRLYNSIPTNDINKIINLPTNRFKKYIVNWLQNLDYIQTENLFITIK